LFVPPYHRPSLQLFNEHIRHEAERSDRRRRHITGTVEGVDLGASTIHLFGTTDHYRHFSVTCDATILALGSPPPWVPPCFAAVMTATSRIAHIYDLSFDRSRLAPDGRVAVVGGGIGAVQLVLHLAHRGFDTTLWNRDPLVPSQFDSDPCFVGPRCGDAFRRIRDYRERRRVIDAERRPGSVPPDLLAELNDAVAAGRVRLLSGEVHNAQIIPYRVGEEPPGRSGSALSGAIHAAPSVGYPHGEPGIRILLTGSSDRSTVTEAFDYVIPATGFRREPPANDLVASIARRNGLAIDDDGYPIPDGALRWRRSTMPRDHEGVPGNDDRRSSNGHIPPDPAASVPIYLTGALGELELGPPARNIIGAHLAGRRIVPDIGRRITDSPR
ncbi:MAG: hypothetical protein ACLFSV_14480, partial [Alkalispirochaeta sp.]